MCGVCFCGDCCGYCFLANWLFGAPQTGQVQLSGSCSKGVPAGMLLSGSPFSGSYM